MHLRYKQRDHDTSECHVYFLEINFSRCVPLDFRNYSRKSNIVNDKEIYLSPKSIMRILMGHTDEKPIH